MLQMFNLINDKWKMEILNLNVSIMKEYESIQSVFPTSADWSDTSLTANPARWASGLPEGASDKVTLAGFGQKQNRKWVVHGGKAFSDVFFFAFSC